MPELPEVETTLRGIHPHLVGQKISRVTIRHFGLRWPIITHLAEKIENQRIQTATRRGKYLLLNLQTGTLIIHLGMSGSLRVLSHHETPKKHDHVDFCLSNHKILRFHDPRRFGAIIWTDDDPNLHPLLKKLGPEPFSKAFSATYLFDISRKRQISIKLFIMNHLIVVGVGNIYANEALFMAGIKPMKKASKVTLGEYKKLVSAIKQVLKAAIKQGGSTLKNFLSSDGKPGYFTLHLKVYGRGNQACLKCKKNISAIRLGQRSTFYCNFCQK